MDRKDRLIASLNFIESDEVPHFIDFTHNKKVEFEHFADEIGFDKQYGNYLEMSVYSGWPTEIEGKPGFFRDEFGVVWNRSGVDKDIGMIDNPPIRDIESYEYRFPEINADRLHGEYARLMSGDPTVFKIAGIGFSMYERLWSLCGMENALMAMLIMPDRVHDLLDQICDYDMKIMDIALQYPIDGFYFGDDWGQQRGLIMGPELWRKFIKPRIKRLYDKAKRNDLYIFQHSCGDISLILEDMVEIGCNCYQTVQPEIYDLGKLKDKFDGRLSFWGTISTQRLLPFADPEKIKQETIKIMNIMKKHGGYIAAPTHSIPEDVPPANIMAMLDVFLNQRRYF